MHRISISQSANSLKTLTQHCQDVRNERTNIIANYNKNSQNMATSLGDVIFSSTSHDGDRKVLRAKNINIAHKNIDLHQNNRNTKALSKASVHISGAPNIYEVDKVQQMYGKTDIHPGEHILADTSAKENAQHIVAKVRKRYGGMYGVFNDSQTAQGALDATTLKNIAAIKLAASTDVQQAFTKTFKHSIGYSYIRAENLSDDEFAPLAQKFALLEKKYGIEKANHAIAFAPARVCKIVRHRNQTITAYPQKLANTPWVDFLVT